MKVTIEFDSIEAANIAYNAVRDAQFAASQPVQPQHFTLPASTGGPVPTPMNYAPQPEQGFVPPMPQGFAPQAPQVPATPPAPPAPPAAPQVQQPAGGPTSADVVKAAQAYAKKFGPAGTKAVLQQFGADAVKDVKPENYVAVIAALAV